MSAGSQPRLLLCLLDWSKFLDTDGGYIGHFIIVVGMENGRVIFLNPDSVSCSATSSSQRISGQSFYSCMDEDTFEKARLANGTDEDLVFVTCRIEGSGI